MAPDHAEYARDLAVSYAKMAESTTGETAHKCADQLANMQARGILAESDKQFLEQAKKNARPE